MQQSELYGEVSLLESLGYDRIQLQTQIAKHFSLLNIAIAPNRRVVIKPNLIMRCSPERAATVHPTVLEALLAHLRDIGVSDILIAESPGGTYTPGILRSLYEKTGIGAVAEKYNVCCNLSVESYMRTRQENRLCNSFEIIAPVTEDVFLINLCKVKTHSMMTMSAGVKNLFGCIPGLLKPQLHYRFSEEESFAKMLVDLSETIRPDLTLVDGVIGMEGDGPTAGSPRFLGITAAARYDGLYALDEMLAKMIGLTAAQVATLSEAQSRGLPNVPVVLGDTALMQRVTPFRPPTGKTLNFSTHAGIFAPMVRALQPHLTPRPMVKLSDCIGCGKCAETCPADIISMTSGKASIPSKGCIRCFCCHEMCPVKAITIREAAIFRFMSVKKRST